MNTSRSKKKRGAGGIVFMVILLLIALGGLIYYLVSPYKGYAVVQQELKFERDALKNEAPPMSAFQVMFDPDQIQKYNDGEGLSVKFIVHSDPEKGYGDRVYEFDLPAWKNYAETSNPSRRRLVQQKKEEFDGIVADFRRHRPISWNYEIAVDITEGVGNDFARQIREIVTDLPIESQVARGDGVEMYFYTITGSSYLERSRVLTSPSESPDSVRRRINSALASLINERNEGTKETSLAGLLANALRVNQQKRNRHIIVFSDGLENSPEETTTFYHGDGKEMVSNPTRWVQLNSVVFRRGQLPNLTGVTVEWYAPPPGPHSPAPLMRDALEFWANALGAKGAKVTTYLGY